MARMRCPTQDWSAGGDVAGMEIRIAAGSLETRPASAELEFHAGRRRTTHVVVRESPGGVRPDGLDQIAYVVVECADADVEHCVSQLQLGAGVERALRMECVVPRDGVAGGG